MSNKKHFSDTYYTKEDEKKAFSDYAPYRYGEVEIDPTDERRIKKTRENLDPILVDIVDGGIEAAVMEAEAAVERTARSTIIREQHDYRASLNTIDCLSVSRVSWAATADPIRMKYPLEKIFPGDVYIYNDVLNPQGPLAICQIIV